MRRRTLLVGAAVVASATAAEVGRRRLLRRLEPRPDLTGAPIPEALPPADPRATLGASPDARVLPPPWEPAPLTALAAWLPDPPGSPAARLASYLWAAPLTLAGLAAGALSGARPRAQDGCILFVGARGPTGGIIRRRGFSAAALGHVVLAVDDAPSARILAHEAVHVRQAERLGPLMAPLYLGLLAIYGYARHPLERAARRGARERRDA